jgi:predicted acylesterase/phospholipase RssA
MTDAMKIAAVLAEERAQIIAGATDAHTPPGPFIGLAFSGGGIRSATFCLGVLQALAARKKLASFDYLSTVSGGGYIGSWLSAWIHRAGLNTVQESLAKLGSQQGDPPGCEEAPEVTWLRRYSNYLAPRSGLLSLDSLTLVATWLRNVMLNLVVVLSVMSAVFLVPLLLLEFVDDFAGPPRAFGFAAAWAALLFFCMIAFNLWHQGLSVNRRRNWLITPDGVVATVLVPAVLAACLGALWLFRQPTLDGLTQAIRYFVLLLLVVWVVWFVTSVSKRNGPGVQVVAFEAIVYLLAGSVAFGVGIGAVYLVYSFWSTTLGGTFVVDGPNPARELALVIALGPPAILGAFGLASIVFTGLVGRVYFERSREWWSRMSSWLMIITAAWLSLALLSFYALPLLKWVSTQFSAWFGVLASGWVGTLFASIFVRKPEAASQRVQLRIDQLLAIAATIFMVGMLIVVAAGAAATVTAQARPESAVEAVAPPAAPSVSFALDAQNDRVRYDVTVTEVEEKPFGTFVREHFEALDSARKEDQRIGPFGVVSATFIAVLLIAVLFGWRVDINKFSLHNMYKNRLVRCYLGASNQVRRNEQPFVGLDDSDDLNLGSLASGTKVQRPLHIINTALNLSQGDNLAWQERKAASFTFSPLHCGFSLASTQGDTTASVQGPAAGGDRWRTPGYRPTKEYGSDGVEERCFTLGMGLATSGAAVSPNMGHTTKPALAFVLTLFNARLGRWSANPAARKWRKPSPRFGLFCLLQELFGYSNERRNFVYLSDGGHFDNLGIYELVRRRCAVIFAVDAGADPERKFADVAGAIRKCRIDLGVEIEFRDWDKIQGNATRVAEQSFATAAIRYDAADPTKDGCLILLKPSLTTGEPADVLNYAKNNPPFPQQSTGDQFFNESQFESYRRLGLHCASRCLQVHGDDLPERVASNTRAAPNVMTEQPTFVTKWIGWVLRRPSAKLPQRDGSLLDFFVVLVAVCALFLLVLAGLSRLAAPPAVLEAPLWRSPTFWFLQVDNLFVPFYTALFMTAYASAVRRAVSEAWRWRPLLIALSCMPALFLAGVDYAENSLLLSALIDAPTAIEGLAVVARLKAWSVGVCAVLLVLSLRWVVPACHVRWRR